MTLASQRLSASLEDYLETIYELVRTRKWRACGTSHARGVRAASVTPAMRKLLELGLIHYEKRELHRSHAGGAAEGAADLAPPGTRCRSASSSRF